MHDLDHDHQNPHQNAHKAPEDPMTRQTTSVAARPFASTRSPAITRAHGPLAALLALLVVLLGAPAQAATAPAGDPAWVRVAHLVPDLPTMDVWLTPFDGDADAAEVLRTSADYGRVKEYQPLAEGLYTVSMRPSGAPESSTPLLSGTFEALAGQAYTVAGLEESGEARVQVLTDDLTPPTEGQARVRLLPAASSVPQLTVTAVGGPTLAQDIGYATPSGYADVPAGPWQLDVTPAAGVAATAASTQVDLTAGGVYTLLVLESAEGLTVEVVTDAQGASVTPVGGAATGRTAEPVGSSAVAPVMAVALALALVLGLVGVRTAVVRRRSGVVRR